MNKLIKLFSLMVLLFSFTIHNENKPLPINAQEDYTVIKNLQEGTFNYTHLNYTTFSTVKYYVNPYGTINPAYAVDSNGYTIYADFIQLFIPNVDVYGMTCDNFTTKLNCFVSTITFFDGNRLPFKSFSIASQYNLTGWTNVATLLTGWSKLITVPRGTQSIGVELYGKYNNTQVSDRTSYLTNNMRIDMVEANYELVLNLNTFTNQVSNGNKIIFSGDNYIPNSRKTNMLLLFPTNNNVGSYHKNLPQNKLFESQVTFYDYDDNSLGTIILRDDIYNGNYKYYLCDPLPDETEVYGRYCLDGYYYININAEPFGNALYFTISLTNNKNGYLTSTGEASPADFTTAELETYTKQVQIFYDNDVKWAQFKTNLFTEYDLRPYGKLVNEPTITAYDTATNERYYLIDEDFSHWYLANDLEKRPFDFSIEQTEFITLFAYYGEYLPPFVGLSPVSPNLPASFILLLDGFNLYNDAGFIFLLIIILLIVNFTILYYQIPKVVLLIANLSVIMLFAIFGMIPLFVLILALAGLLYYIIMTIKDGGLNNG